MSTAIGVRLAVALSVAPHDEQQQQDRGEEQVEGVGIGVQADRPDLRADRERDADADADDEAAGEVRVPVAPTMPHAPATSSAESMFARSAALPNGCRTTDASQSEQRVRRVAGRVGDAEHRAEGLELGRVPVSRRRA